jgi:hypothetical protein
MSGITVSPRAARTVLLRLQALPELRQLCSVSGEFDLPGAAACAEPRRGWTRCSTRSASIEGVARTHTSVVLAVRIDRRA